MRQRISHVKNPYGPISKGAMRRKLILSSALVDLPSLLLHARRERSQAGAFRSPADDGIEPAFKILEADEELQRITEVSSENDSASVVNQATEVLARKRTRNGCLSDFQSPYFIVLANNVYSMS